MHSPIHVVSAAVLVLDEDEKLLFVKTSRRGWEIPGGQVDIGERPSEAATRETAKKSGIEVKLYGLCEIF